MSKSSLSERPTCADCGTIIVSRLATFRADEPTCYCCQSDQTLEDYDPEPGTIETQATQIDLSGPMEDSDE